MPSRRRPGPASPRTPRSRSRASAASEAEASELIDGDHRGGHRRRPGDRRPVRALGEVRADERPRPLRGGARGGRGGEPSDTPELYIAAWALSELIEAATQDRQRRARRGRARAARRAHGGQRRRLGARPATPGRRALLSDGEAAERLYREAHRPPGPHAAPARPRARAPALRGVAAPRAPPRRRARTAARGARAVRDDRHGGVRRARARVSCWPRASGCASGPPRRATS